MFNNVSGIHSGNVELRNLSAERTHSLSVAICVFISTSISPQRRICLRLSNLVFLFIAATICVLAASMITVVPIGIYVALSSSSIVVTAYTVVGGWVGYCCFRVGIVLLCLRIRMLRVGRGSIGEADAALLEASVPWPFRSRTKEEKGDRHSSQ